jgi:hypothetical protein
MRGELSSSPLALEFSPLRNSLLFIQTLSLLPKHLECVLVRKDSFLIKLSPNLAQCGFFLVFSGKLAQGKDNPHPCVVRTC